MTTEQKNLLLGFLEISGVNKEVRDFEMNVRNQVSKIIDLLPSENSKKGLQLESDLLNLIDLLKWSYFDYGVSAEETLDSWKLNWTPKEIIIPENENVTKIA